MVVSRAEIDEGQREKLNSTEQMIFDLSEQIIDEAIKREYISGKTKKIKIEFPFYLKKHNYVMDILKKRYGLNGWKLDIKHRFIAFSWATISPQPMPKGIKLFGHRGMG
jgi:hypothetical protein